MTRALALGLALVLAPAGARALTLRLPAPATTTATRDEALASRDMAAGPWRDGKLPRLTVEGPLHEVAWRIDQRSLPTLRLIDDLRSQLKTLGYMAVYQCSTDDCGGFDFRYALGTLPEPQMHVDLGDFRYLLAVKGAAGARTYVALLVSRSAAASFVQMVQVGAGATPPLTGTPAATTLDTTPPPSTPVSAPLNAKALGAALEASGSVALDNLDFATGSANLAQGDYPTLAALAAYLLDNPARIITVVGHTDAEGAMAANIVLSKRRAESVRRRLIGKYGVAPGQVTAAGVGYLAPRASNQTQEGRTENRRVEIMLTSTR